MVFVRIGIKELRYNNSMNKKVEEATFVISQYDIDLLQEMLENEKAKRRRVWEGRENDSFDNATVVVPLNVVKGRLSKSLLCSVDIAEAADQGLL